MQSTIGGYMWYKWVYDGLLWYSIVCVWNLCSMWMVQYKIAMGAGGRRTQAVTVTAAY